MQRIAATVAACAGLALIVVGHWLLATTAFCVMAGLELGRADHDRSRS